MQGCGRRGEETGRYLGEPEQRVVDRSKALCLHLCLGMTHVKMLLLISSEPKFSSFSEPSFSSRC